MAQFLADKPYRSALIIAFILVTVCGLISCPVYPLWELSLPDSGGGYDFFHYYASILGLNCGMAIYSPAQMSAYTARLSQLLLSQGHDIWAVYDNHPLPFYLLYLPFSQGTFAEGFYWQLGLQLSLYAAALLALTRLLIKERATAWIWTFLLFCWGLFSGPGLDNICLGQVGFLLTAMLALGFVFYKHNLSSLAGCCLAVAILCKLYPALLLFYFWRKRSYSVIYWTLGSIAVLSLSAGLQWGFQYYAQYWHLLTAGLTYQTSPGNQSLMALLAALLYDLAPSTIKIVNLVVITLGLAALWKVQGDIEEPDISSLTPNEEAPNAATKKIAQDLLTYSAWIYAALLLSPLAWTHHHLQLVIPLLALATYVYNQGICTKQELLWASLGVLCICIQFICEGETVTSPVFKAWHLVFCMGRGGLILTVAQLGCCLALLKSFVRSNK